MSRFPIITPRQLIAALKKKGFYEDRQVGSHLILVNSQRDQTISVPIHKGKTLGRGLTLAILKDANLSREEFLESLKK